MGLDNLSLFWVGWVMLGRYLVGKEPRGKVPGCTGCLKTPKKKQGRRNKKHLGVFVSRFHAVSVFLLLIVYRDPRALKNVIIYLIILVLTTMVSWDGGHNYGIFSTNQPITSFC